MIKAYVDSNVENCLIQLATELDMEVPKAMKMSARRICVNLAYETEPRGFDEDARQMGLNAVHSDIRKVFALASDVFASFDDLKLAKAFYAKMMDGDFDAAQSLMTASASQFAGLSIGDVNPSIHESARGARGKVPRNAQPRMVAKVAQDVVDYISKIQVHVGLCAAGWAACTKDLGGNRGIPAWKKGSHKVAHQLGNVTDNSRADNAVIILENLVPYSEEACDDRKMTRAAEREQVVMADLLDRAIAAAAKKAGF